MKHTPGPWRHSNTATVHEIYAGTDDLPIAVIAVDRRNETLFLASYANARLIAGAPELLQVVRDAAETLTAALDAGELTDALYLLRVRLADLLARLEEL